MKVGLSLGGGGAKGAYQIGVLKALEEYNLIDSINVISGVSIGAINAYFYLCSNNSQTVYDIWLNGIKKNPFKEEPLSRMDRETGGFYSMDIVREMAKIYLDENLFKSSNKDFYVVLTKIKEPTLVKLALRSNRKKVIVHLNYKENPLDYVIASGSIPVVFGFQNIDDNYYVDGGISDNNPINVLVEKGVDVIFHSSFEKNMDINKYSDKNVTLIELTSMYSMPALRLTRFLSSVAFDIRLFERRVKYGYFVTKSMIEYLLQEKILIRKENKYEFNVDEKSFNNITIPEKIHEKVREMYKKDKG